MATTLIGKLREEIGFTRNPLIIDDGTAFGAFLSFAFGSSDEAVPMQNAWANEAGISNKQPGDKATKAEAANYVDWLIVNFCGEDTPEVAGAA